MAVKAKAGNFLNGLRIIAGNGKMALQALLILDCKFREFALKFVAQTAFLLWRPADDLFGGTVDIPDFIMGIVALDAGFKTLPGGCFLTCVPAGGDFICHIFMAGRTLIGSEEIFRASVGIGRVGMTACLADAAVAILAGQPAVNGYVKALVVNHPTGLSGGCHS